MQEVVDLTRELVRIPSVSSSPADVEAVTEVLRDRLDTAGVETRIVAGPSRRPVLVGRVPGPDDRPPLVLLSHSDVVPVEQDDWQRDPFSGEVVDGELWGRGSLDMKSVAALHIAAAAALAADDRRHTRELLIVVTPDEEIGGVDGAVWLLDTHPSLAGFRDGVAPPEVLSEGGYGLTGIVRRPVMPIVLGEKSPLVVRARAAREPAHAAMADDDRAIQALAGFVDAVSGPRAARVHPVMRQLFSTLAEAADGPTAQVFRLLAGAAGPVAIRPLASLLRARAGAIGHLLADSVTPTMFQSGYATNVVPGDAEAVFDCRLLPDSDPDDLLAWLTRVGRRRGVTVEELHRSPAPSSTPGPLFDLLLDASERLVEQPLATPSLTPPVTDLRHFRARGATGYGWVPIVLDPSLLATIHGHDERIPVDGLVAGARAMTEVVLRACTGET